MIDPIVFDFIYEMAVNDATNLGPKSITGEKETVFNHQQVKKAVFDYASNIINGNADESSFSKTILQILDEEKGLTFGKAQKLVNMTMKYLFIRYYEDSEIRERYMLCHAPMDRIMRFFVYESYMILQLGKNPGFSKEGSWSQMGIDAMEENGEYSCFQEAINNIIREKKLDISRIEFDYRFWAFAKKNGKRTSIQKYWDQFPINK